MWTLTFGGRISLPHNEYCDEQMDWPHPHRVREDYWEQTRECIVQQEGSKNSELETCLQYLQVRPLKIRWLLNQHNTLSINDSLAVDNYLCTHWNQMFVLCTGLWCINRERHQTLIACYGAVFWMFWYLTKSVVLKLDKTLETANGMKSLQNIHSLLADFMKFTFFPPNFLLQECIWTWDQFFWSEWF